MLESEIKKLTVAVEELTAAFKSKSAGAAPASTTPETPPPSPAQAEPVAAPPTAAPVMEVPPAAPPAAAPAAEAVDKKTLTEAFIKLAQEKGRETCAALLAEFGITKLPELKDEAQWPAFYAKVQAALGA